MSPFSSTTGNSPSLSMKSVAMRTVSSTPLKWNSPCSTAQESRLCSSLSVTVLRYNLLPSSDDTDEEPSTLYELAHDVSTATAVSAYRSLVIGD